jgi:hypothetical protein
MLTVPLDSTNSREHRGMLARAVTSLQRYFDGSNFTVPGIAKASSFNSSAGVTAAVASGTPITIGGVGNKVASLVLVCVVISTPDAANYTAYAIIANTSSAWRIIHQVNGGLLTVTLSGANIQATQSSGTTTAMNYTITYFG